jgi:hypothetical protein
MVPSSSSKQLEKSSAASFLNDCERITQLEPRRWWACKIRE